MLQRPIEPAILLGNVAKTTLSVRNHGSPGHENGKVIEWPGILRADELGRRDVLASGRKRLPRSSLLCDARQPCHDKAA